MYIVISLTCLMNFQHEVLPNTSHDPVETTGVVKGEKGKSKDKSRDSKDEEKNKMLMFSDPYVQVYYYMQTQSAAVY